MEERLSHLLTQLIDQYIDSAQPVSSGALVEGRRLAISSATARNYLAELEEGGYIYQPHTSAGRIPTEEGYRYHVSTMKSCKLSRRIIEELSERWIAQAPQGEEVALKQLAKQLATTAEEAVFVAFSKNDTYYTGLSHLFSKPELGHQDVVHSLSAAIDQLDTVLAEHFETMPQEPTILVGSSNPFSSVCSVVVSKYLLGQRWVVVGILGPMRMQYAKNKALMDHVTLLLTSGNN